MPGITPISGDYTVGTGLIFFRPQGQAYFEELGDCDQLNVSFEFEELERRSKQFGMAKLVHSAVTGTDVSIELTLLQMTPRNRALGAASDLADLTQTAATAQTYTITDVAAGGIYELPAIDLSNVSVSDGEATPTAYTEGADYELDAEAGLIRIIQIPSGAGANVEVTYDAAEITAADGRAKLGLAGNGGIRGALKFRGVNDIGVKVLVDLWDVQLRPSGPRSYIGDDYMQVQLAGKVFADASQAAAYQYGQERTL